jgi:hypothetical protein
MFRRADSDARRARPFLVAAFLVALCASPVAAAPTPTFAGVRTWAPVQWALGSQRRMLQTATVGMCLALWIIMWRK